MGVCSSNGSHDDRVYNNRVAIWVTISRTHLFNDIAAYV